MSLFFNIISESGFRPFIMSVKTDNAGTSTSTQFTIPTFGAGYNYRVEYDGNILLNQTGNVTLEFGVAGTYDVKIYGDFPQIYFNNTGDKSKLVDIKQWGSIAWSSMQGAFWGCNSLTAVTATDAPDLSNVTVMSNMFRSCSSLTTLDVSNWNVSSVINMSNMFRQCTSLTALDVSLWNVVLVTNFTDFLLSTTLDTPSYDAMLIQFEATNQNNVLSFHGGNSRHTAGSAAATARAALIADHSWTITDGEPI